MALLPNLIVVFTLPMLTYSSIRRALDCEHSFLNLNKILIYHGALNSIAHLLFCPKTVVSDGAHQS